VGDFAAALRQGGAYVNFLGDEVSASSPGLPRADLGSADGDQGSLRTSPNLFQRNQNVPPAIKRPGQ
jgi:hypothetical protein